MTEIVRVFRVLEYIGTRKWVEGTIAKSIHGTRDFGFGCVCAATLGTYLESAEELPIKMLATDIYL